MGGPGRPAPNPLGEPAGPLRRGDARGRARLAVAGGRGGHALHRRPHARRLQQPVPFFRPGERPRRLRPRHRALVPRRWPVCAGARHGRQPRRRPDGHAAPALRQPWPLHAASFGILRRKPACRPSPARDATPLRHLSPPRHERASGPPALERADRHRRAGRRVAAGPPAAMAGRRTAGARDRVLWPDRRIVPGNRWLRRSRLSRPAPTDPPCL